MSTNENNVSQAALDIIAGHAVKGEVAAWTRKRKSIERIIATNIRPLEDQIIELNAKLQPLYDQLKTMRQEMVEFCIHPIDMLVEHEDHVLCKFCDARLAVPKKFVE
jgi:hypothetical protein